MDMRRDIAERTRRRAGFSLVEVLVALVVAGILAMAFIGLQRQTAEVASSTSLDWQHINFAQEFLAKRKADKSTGAWIPWTDISGAEWRQEVAEEELIPVEGEAGVVVSANVGAVMVRHDILETRIHSFAMRWEWRTRLVNTP